MTVIIVKQDSKVVQKQSATYQFLAIFVVNLLALVYGTSRGWTSPNNPILMSDDTPLPTGKISSDQAAFIAALTCPGALIGNFAAGFICSNFGRKMPLLFLAIPTIIGWLLVLFAQNVYYLYAARLLKGFSGGCVFVIIPLYSSEIANDSVRGVLGSMIGFFTDFGILCSYTLGNYCDYYTIPIFVITINVICVILFAFFPESPIFLLKHNKIKEATKSIRFYQNIRETDGKSKSIETEMVLMNKLKAAIQQPELSEKKNSFNWSDLMTNPGRKALIIGMGLALLSPMSGVTALLCYTANVFEEAGSNLSPNSSTMTVGGILFVGAIISTNLVDRAGRKFLYAISTIGSTLGYSTLGTYMMLKTMGYEVETYNWIPIASFSFALFAASWGILTLPYVIVAEIMPENLKDFGTTICISLIWIFAFIFIRYFPILTDVIGSHGCMFLFAGACSFGGVLIHLFLPETKAKSHAEIMEMLR